MLLPLENRLEGLGSVTRGCGETTTEGTLGDRPPSQPVPLLTVQLSLLLSPDR